MLNNLWISNPWLVAIAINTVLMAIAFAIPKKLLTPAGYANAWLLGVIVWGALGWRGYATTLFYFVVGSAITKVGSAQKEAEGTAEARGGVRGPGNVWGSALTGAVCALAIVAIRLGSESAVDGGLTAERSSVWLSLLTLGFVASLSTKLSDTTATEIGKAYGQRTFLITTLQPVPRGTEGAVSLEGTLAGAIASVALGAIAWCIGLIPLIGVGVCAVAALGATTVESIIGATIEEKLMWLTHDLVNVINTTIGALLAIGIGWFIL
ncbi:MAG: TIGR00297 family protein [Leptolyngbya foveolarum]|uniref:TIGR00297 family protein n=1 Tax=Leptolyngbya foveolarum TaxID=47253 RepID=A0A2W4WK01_9CYAN|nr:MAG: TIGR00297 family protein [Leptolyngbya foveolarum]